MGETGTSLYELHATARANPHDAGAWLALAEGLAASGDAERALTALRHGHALSGERPAALIRASALYGRLARRSEALHAARLALHLDPASESAALAVAEHLLALEDPHAAALTLRVAATRHPKSSDVQLALAEACLEAAKPKDALRHARRAAELGADPRRAHRARAEAHRRLGQLDEEIEALATLVDAVREDADAALTLGERLAERGRRAEAAELLRGLAESPPKDAALLVRLGRALTDAHALIPAVRCLREAIRHNPDLPSAHLWLGRALYEGGALADAARSLQSAASLAPQDPEPNYRLGLALRDADRPREAAAAFIRAAALAPDDARIQEVLTDTLGDLKAKSAGPVPAAPIGNEGTDGGFTGDLALFSLSELLEFLLTQHATGELLVRAGGEEGVVHLYRGHISGIRYPGGKSFSALLVEGELVTLTDLKRNVIESDDLELDDVVAKVVLHRGLAQRDPVEDLMRSRVQEGLHQLIGWRSGQVLFRRSEPAAGPPEITVDTRWALLETMRRIDEEGRAS